MNAQTELPMTKAEFNRWLLDLERSSDRSRPHRYEWVEGRVMQMVNTTRDHGRVVLNILQALVARLDPSTWEAFVLEFGVEMAGSLRYPDVVVEPAGGDGHGRWAERPIILVEVLSGSSAKTDLIDKVAEYTSLPSLEAYVVASQDEAVCWHWQRQADGSFLAKPAEARGRDVSLPLTARGIELPLSEIYRGTKAE